jgi:Tol biopolymer transport system component
MIANEDGSGERRLARRKHPDVFRQSGPAWSPDDRIIACPVESEGASVKTVIGVRVADGEEELITKQKWEDVGQVAWLAAGTGLLVTARDPQEALTHIWYIAWPSGETSRITRELNAYNNVSLTANSATLTSIQRNYLVYLYVAPAGDLNRARKITSGPLRMDGDRGLTWTPDGRIVYRSLADGAYNIYIVNADGTGDRRLSEPAEQNLDPTVAPNGNYLAWTTSRNGYRNIWRMNLDGSNQQPLTNGKGEWFPQFTSDGWLIYQSQATASERDIRKKRLENGEIIQLTTTPSSAPALSPDGKLIACNYRQKKDERLRIAVISVDDGKLLNLFDPVDTLSRPETPNDRFRPLRWMPDGKALAYIVTDNGVSNIWSQSLAGGNPQQLTNFTSEEIFNFAWSRDGKHLALSRGVVNNDVVQISDHK